MKVYFLPRIDNKANRNSNGSVVSPITNLNKSPQNRRLLNSDSFISFSGSEQYTINELKYLKFLEQISEKEAKSVARVREFNWLMQTKSIFSVFQAKIPPIISRKRVLKKLEIINQDGITDEKLQESIDKVIDYYKKCTAKPTKSERALKRHSRAVLKKLNDFRPMIGNKYLSRSQISKSLSDEKDIAKRKEIYAERFLKPADLHKDDFLNLIKLRNQVANEKGYANYFEYKIVKDFNIDETTLTKLVDELEAAANPVFGKIADINNEKLADAFGISKNELQPWHFGYLTDENPLKEINSNIKNSDTVKDFSFKLYKSMGWDVQNLPIDIYEPTKKGLMLPASCAGISPNNKAGITISFSNSINSIKTLNHELGHAVYYLGYADNLAHFEKKPSSTAMTEAIAMMTGALHELEPGLANYLNLPKSVVDKTQKYTQETFLQSLNRILHIVKFEQELYSNPNQDLSALWYKLQNRFLKTNPPAKLDNVWASFPHYFSHPGYYQNYLRAEVMRFQIYEAAHKALGPLTQNNKTAEFFKENIFKYGSSLTDEEIMKRLTGKGISTDAICNFIKKIKI